MIAATGAGDYRRDAGLHQLWEMPAIKLVASAYAVGEARRNQDRTEQRAVLEALLQSVQVLAATSGDLDVRDRLAEDFLMAVGEHVEIEAETTVRPTVISGTLSGLMTGWGCRYGTLDDTADHPQGTLLAASIGVLSGRNRCGIGTERWSGRSAQRGCRRSRESGSGSTASAKPRSAAKRVGA